MTYNLLDDKFHSHPKVVAAPLAAVGLFAKSIAYCGDYLTDGFVPERWAESQVTSREPGDLLAQMVELGFWRVCEGGFAVVDYLDYNPSRADVEGRRSAVSAMRAAAGKKGAAARWNGKPDGKRDGKRKAKS